MLLPHVLDRTIEIRAMPDRVFGYFTDSARWAVGSFSGTNYFTLDAHGRIAAVAGFWNSVPKG